MAHPRPPVAVVVVVVVGGGLDVAGAVVDVALVAGLATQTSQLPRASRQQTVG